MAAISKRLGLASLLFVLTTIPAVAACTGEPELVYRAQSPLLATQPGTALELRVHDGNCVAVDYPRQQGGGSRSATVPAAALTPLRHALDAALAPAQDDPGSAAKTAMFRREREIERHVLDADLLSVEWRQGKRFTRLAWRHGEGIAHSSKGISRLPAPATLTPALRSLRQEFELLADVLRQLPPPSP